MLAATARKICTVWLEDLSKDTAVHKVEVWHVGGFPISIQDPLMFNAWCCRDDVPGLPQFLPPLQLVQVLLVFNDEAVVLAKFLCKLLCHTTARLPCLRGKIRAKGQAALDVE